MPNNCLAPYGSPHGVQPDPFFANVVLLLHMENGVLTDSSSSHKTVSMSGPTLSNADHQFGLASARFASSTDVIQLPTSTDFDMPGDFTLEAWIKPDFQYSDGGTWSLFDFRGSGASNALYVVGLRPTSGVNRPFMFLGSGSILYGTSQAAALNAWSHVAYCRSNGVITAYVNGQPDATTLAYSGSIVTGANPVIGSKDAASSVNSYGARGWVDEVRITKGVARYTGPFTPQSSAFADSAT